MISILASMHTLHVPVFVCVHCKKCIYTTAWCGVQLDAVAWQVLGRLCSNDGLWNQEVSVHQGVHTMSCNDSEGAAFKACLCVDQLSIMLIVDARKNVSQMFAAKHCHTHVFLTD
ncbi:unnamed protein product [Schistosoma intercalatum]|nr:unnamed protein product [Schistosoma intercalatum]